MNALTSRRLTYVLSSLLLLIVPTLAAAVAGGDARLVVDREAAHLEIDGEEVALPRQEGRVYSTVVGLGVAADGTDTVNAEAEAWIAAGVETRTLPPSAPEEARFAAEETRRLVLYEVRSGDAAGVVNRLPAPRATAPVLRDPLPLARAGELEGVAWLEGPDVGALAVRFAPRQADGEGDGWGDAETVSPRGPGSQLALRSAHLDDGSTLLTWSRFDGEDDEIFFSLRRDGAPAGGWSVPARVHADDVTPDITPALLAVPGGALVAWASYTEDGYRIYTARWDGSSWSTPAALPGVGSFPTFETSGGIVQVLYRSAEGWRVAELDRQGRALRQASVRAPSRHRPRVVSSDGAGPSLCWGVDCGDRDQAAALHWEPASPERGETGDDAPVDGAEGREEVRP